MSHIHLSPKHGINPCIPRCYFCGESKNELLLLGRLPGDAEAPRNACFDKNPCDKCAGYMKDGVILMSVREETFNEEPYRTGGFWVVKETFFAEGSDPRKRRVAWVTNEVARQIGLPGAEKLVP